MRKFLLLFLIAGLACLSFTSCKHKKGVEQIVQESIPKPHDQYNGQDTTEVMSLAGSFIEHLNAKDIQGAVSMLYFLDGDSIKPLPAGLQRRQTNALVNIQGIRYNIDKLVFDQEKDNEVKVDIVLFDKKPGDTRPNTISFYLKPVRRDGHWFLTTADNITDTNQLQGTKIEN